MSQNSGKSSSFLPSFSFIRLSSAGVSREKSLARPDNKLEKQYDDKRGFLHHQRGRHEHAFSFKARYAAPRAKLFHNWVERGWTTVDTQWIKRGLRSRKEREVAFLPLAFQREGNYTSSDGLTIPPFLSVRRFIISCSFQFSAGWRKRKVCRTGKGGQGPRVTRQGGDSVYLYHYLTLDRAMASRLPFLLLPVIFSSPL